MPGSITLPQVVLDLEEEDRKAYEALKAPTSIVVRYGYMRMVGEFPYGGDAKPGCGSKLVVRSPRGIELGEMLTTTCGNGGCGKNITRKQMLEYIDNSGGRDYPFTNQGKILRIATPEDMTEQNRLDAQKMPMIKFTKQLIAELDLPMKLVDIEWLLGGERIIFHYASETWIDFRELVKRLSTECQTRIEMHQVNARDEARLVADYEKCGQHCCCKQFLKVLKPVSMRSAKVQKATLDPTKISGRCGRLMCCLRYEDETYESLRKKLPNRQSRVMTEDGPGTVLDTQILTQLALIKLDNAPAPVAIAIENITIMLKTDPNFRPPDPPEPRPRREERRPPERLADQAGPAAPGAPGSPAPSAPPSRAGQGPGQGRGPVPRQASPDHEPRRPQPGAPLRSEEIEAREGQPISSDGVGDQGPDETGDMEDETSGGPMDGPENVGPNNQQGQPGAANQGGQPGPAGEGGRRRRRRRRRRGRGGGGGPGGSQGGNPGPQGGGGPPQA